MTNISNELPPTGSDPLEFDALQAVLEALRNLPTEARHRVLGAASTFFGLSPAPLRQPYASHGQALPDIDASFSASRAPSPKEFLFEKSPPTDLARVACLAYYLTHYRDTPHFKTIDISKLNTESAQLKLSNAAYAVDNAAKAGLLVPATKGNKQLSSVGERYVEALPDRDAARQAVAQAKPKRNSRKRTRKFMSSDDADGVS